MVLENLNISRICLHEVKRRNADGSIDSPTYGGSLLSLSPQAMMAFRKRVVSAFASSAQCMEMAIHDFGPGSAIAMGEALASYTDAQFVANSGMFADALSNAQGSAQIPGGLMCVFDGTVGQPSTSFFGLMKAELHEGFIKQPNLQADYVDNLFLSPKTKLYKIGMFVSDGASPRPALPNGWSAQLYDATMTATQRENAAIYFYSTFLGLSIPENSAQQVKKFFELTREFIDQSALDEHGKVELYNGLYAYLRLDQSPTIQVAEFANTFLGDGLIGTYQTHMSQNNFPTSAINKDLSEIAAALRTRKLRFPGSIVLSGPSQAVEDRVKVQEVHNDNGDRATVITIQGGLLSQE